MAPTSTRNRLGCERRVWHKDLIKVLPDTELRDLWNEVKDIARALKAKEEIRATYLRRVTDYPITHLKAYAVAVVKEQQRRSIKVHGADLDKYFGKRTQCAPWEEVFKGWHDDKYKSYCHEILLERYQMGVITEEEWKELNSRLVLDFYEKYWGGEN